MPQLRIQSLHKAYDSHVAVESMDLSIPDGSFCVFLGPSGCGKSTTLNCIAGLESVTSGRILLGDADITDLAPHRRDIAMVFQSSLLYPHLTAMQNIRMGRRTANVSVDVFEKRVARALDMLNIRKLVDKKPSAMSGGERQRVAMAKAIVREPAAFLMDEPLAALDASLRQSLRTELVHLQKQLGVTTVFVTHDQIEAMTMGDLIVVINQGRVEQVGTPQEIYQRPKTRFVAGFLGWPPMNFLKGRLAEEGGATVFRTKSCDIQIPHHIVGGLRSGVGELELGIRPQHMSLSSEKVSGSISASVYAVEQLGKENVVVVEDGEKQTLRVLTDPRFQTRIGEQVFLVPDTENSVAFY